MSKQQMNGRESEMSQPTLTALTQVAARGAMSVIFLVAGVSKINGYTGTQAYMDSMGVPGELLPLVIALELVGGLSLLLGWKVRISAFLLAGFSVLSAVIFHWNFADQMQSILFMKNIAIAGGLLLLVTGPTHTWSVDAKTS
jgi:putative oxidoreductase